MTKYELHKVINDRKKEICEDLERAHYEAVRLSDALQNLEGDWDNGSKLHFLEMMFTQWVRSKEKKEGARCLN